MTTENLDNTATDTSTEDEDQFAAGFENGNAPTETPGPADDDTSGEQETSTTPAPEYVQLTKQEVEELKARAALVQEIKATQDKSFGTLGNTIRSIRQDLEAMRQGKKVDIEQADIDALREDFPPLAAALEKVRDLQVIGAGSLDQDAIGKLVDERAAAKVTTLQQSLEARFLKRVHPDWEQYGESADFKDWVQAQPAEYQQQLAAASDAWDSDFIGDAMTKAKEAAKQRAAASAASTASADTRRSRMSAAVTPRGSGATPGPNDDDQFHEGFKTG